MGQTLRRQRQAIADLVWPVAGILTTAGPLLRIALSWASHAPPAIRQRIAHESLRPPPEAAASGAG